MNTMTGDQPRTLIAMQPGERCNKGGDDTGGIVYPKSALLPSGRIVMTYERSIGDPVGQSQWVYASDDNGETWRKISEVLPPSELTKGTGREAEFARFTSNWTDPYLYVLPEDIGEVKAGTLLLATVVSGDDHYWREQKTLHGDEWFNPADGDREHMAIVLYASDDEGVTWRVLSLVDEGGWQGGSARAKPGEVCSQRNIKENGYAQMDPIWEPYLMVHDHRLVCYFSDERDSAEDEAAGIERGGQILVHRTSTDCMAWDELVPDVGYTQAHWRPGMTNVVPTSDGRWFFTYEWIVEGGSEVRFKISDDPLDFDAEDPGRSITELGDLAEGGSPVLVRLPNGTIFYNAAGSGDLWLNRSGNPIEPWERWHTPMPGGFSRNIMWIPATQRVLLLCSDFTGGSVLAGTYAFA